MSRVPERIDYATYAKGLLPGIFRGKTIWGKILEVFAAPCQRLEAALLDLLLLRSIAAATGKNLDIIGEILNVKRLAADDARYRIRLYAKILILKSSGTIPQLLAILVQIMPGTYFFRNIYPKGWVAEAQQATTEAEAEELAAALGAAKVAGVRGYFIWSEVDLADSFTFSPDDTMPASDTQGFAGEPAADGSVVLHAGEVYNTPSSSYPKRIVTDGEGTWVIAGVDDANAPVSGDHLIKVSTDDGATFTSVSLSGDVFIAGGLYHNGAFYLFGSHLGGEGVIYRAEPADMETWTTITLGVGDAEVYAMAANGEILVAVGESHIYSSTDNGETFTVRTDGFGGDVVVDVKWVDFLGKFVAGGGTKIATSSDGTTWAHQTTGLSGSVVALAVGVDTVVACTNSASEAVWSDDGTTWNLVNPGAGSGAQDVLYTAGWFWMVNSNELLQSVTGASWSVVAATNGNASRLVDGFGYAPLLVQAEELFWYDEVDGAIESITTAPDFSACGVDPLTGRIWFLKGDVTSNTTLSFYRFDGGLLAGVIDTGA
jgi:hypothetical protein